MGDIGVSTTPDRNAPHWNGSKLAFIDEQWGGGLSYVPWLRKLVTDIDLGYASAYTKLSPRSAIGISAKYFSLGDIQFTGRSGSVTRTYKPREYMVGIDYSY